MQSQNRNRKITVTNEYHTLHRKAGLKADPDRTFIFLNELKFLADVTSPEGIQPTAKLVDGSKNVKSPESNRDFMKNLGCLRLSR